MTIVWNAALVGFAAMTESMALRGTFWIPAPRFHEDKLCGNDRQGYEGLRPCRGFGGVLGACNAPLRGYAVTVQRDAAEGLGVSPNLSPVSLRGAE
jgi:hypothetical protein